MRKIPIAKPKSPTLFTIKAFIAALFADSFLNQNPINKYEHSPTPSQPKNNCKKLSDTTNANIAKVNKDKYDINLGLFGSCSIYPIEYMCTKAETVETTTNIIELKGSMLIDQLTMKLPEATH